MTVNHALAQERNVAAFLMEMGVERNVKLGRPRTTEDNVGFGPVLLKVLASVIAE
jgi:hypothetical protein